MTEVNKQEIMEKEIINYLEKYVEELVKSVPQFYSEKSYENDSGPSTLSFITRVFILIVGIRVLLKFLRHNRFRNKVKKYFIDQFEVLPALKTYIILLTLLI
ncbi:MAG: hypothetical protein FJW56_02915 [Actinobacteria bacterium]|nr:hypothetical protein [Actinomycetota bacterium]